MRLGSLFGPSEAVLDSLGPSNALKHILYFKVFANTGFDTLELLMGFLESPSWPLLVRSGSKMGPQNGPQNGSTSIQKLVQQMKTT